MTREYDKAVTALTKSDAALRAALDRLVAARERGTPAECVERRAVCRTLYNETEIALHEVHRLHREHWRQRASALQKEALSAMGPLRSYRAALRLAGDPDVMAQVLAHDALQQPDPALDGPQLPEPPASLDRADEMNVHPVQLYPRN